jgi:hypothetical protein
MKALKDAAAIRCKQQGQKMHDDLTPTEGVTTTSETLT